MLGTGFAPINWPAPLSQRPIAAGKDHVVRVEEADGSFAGVPERTFKTRLAGVTPVEALADDAFQASFPKGMDTGASVSVLEPPRIDEQLIFASRQFDLCCHDALRELSRS